uniref:Uncharacterized protein n=1 Tax=Athene cunicularia TaxID=194338 RepID=A0A663MVF4_ATHCN
MAPVPPPWHLCPRRSRFPAKRWRPVAGLPWPCTRTPRQLFWLLPGFPHDGGQVGRRWSPGAGHGTHFPATDTRSAHPRPSVVVGAPHANTSQPGVDQPGAVFLCPWHPSEPSCHPLLIDTTGATLNLHTYKSNQWLGASVTSWDGKLACAPLQHWNVMDGQQEAFRTPTGACFVGAPGLRRIAWYSPCRDQL